MRGEADVVSSPVRTKVAKLVTPSGHKLSSSKGAVKERKIGEKLAARAEKKHDRMLTESPTGSAIETPQKSTFNKSRKVVHSKNPLAVWHPGKTRATRAMAAATRRRKREREEESSNKQNKKRGQISVKVTLNSEIVGDNLEAEASV